jgi:dipeptidase
MSPGLKEFAQSKGWWKPDEEFNFSQAFSHHVEDAESKKGRLPSGRQQWGHKLLTDLSQDGGSTTFVCF